MRTGFAVLLLLGLLTGGARGQSALAVGSPESAFAGGPIQLSKQMTALLRARYQGDKVPLVPQPFRGRLDTALAGRDWPRVEAVKKELAAAQGIVAALSWEQSRFIATGSIGVAEMHALDIAATGSNAIAETAVMLWFYSVAVTMTDGHKCSDEAVKDAYLDRLRGPAFEPVTRIVRTIADDRLAAMRDLAIRLEATLAPVRNDDTMCRVGNRATSVKPDGAWRAEAAMTRAMLPRHLVALASVMRPRPIVQGEMRKGVVVKPEVLKIEPVLPDSVLSLPMLPEPAVIAPVAEPRTPVRPVVEKAAMPERPRAEPPKSEPKRSEPPNLRLTTPEAAGH